MLAKPYVTLLNCTDVYKILNIQYEERNTHFTKLTVFLNIPVF